MRFIFCLLGLASSISINSNGPFTKSGVINPHYTGLGIEWGQVKNFFMLNPTSNKAKDSAPPNPGSFNPLIIQLLKNIISLQDGPPGSDKMILRIGGKSANNIWYLPANLPPFDLTLSDVVPIQEFHLQLLDMAADITGIKMTIGLSMRKPNPADNYNPQFLEGVKKFMKPENILNLELGNEPDLYVQNGFRPATYTPEEFFTETQALIDFIKPILPNIQFSGPSYAYPWTESGHFDLYIKRFVGVVSSFTYHRYDLRGCSSETSLLELMAVPKIDQYKKYEAAKKTLIETGKPGSLTWNEGGSASCGGIEGTSNVWGSALWALDAQLQSVWIGVEEVNFSGSPQARYGPIQKEDLTGKVVAAPTYFALLAMKIIGKGDKPMVYDIPNTDTIPHVKIWRVDNGNGVQTIVVINKDFKPAPAVVLEIAQPTGSGSNVRIIRGYAPGGSADKVGPFYLSGITLDEKTGMPTGTSTEEKMTVSGGILTVTVQPETFAIIRFGRLRDVNLLDPLLGVKAYIPGTKAIDDANSAGGLFASKGEFRVFIGSLMAGYFVFRFLFHSYF